MKDKIKALLEEMGFLPVKEPNWHSFVISQFKGLSSDVHNEISKSLPAKTNGLYIYQFENQKDEYLYVGKGKPIKSRILKHYEKSTRTKKTKRNVFLQEHTGVLRINWKQVEEEEDRKVIEAMLEYILEPKYVIWKKTKQ